MPPTLFAPPTLALPCLLLRVLLYPVLFVMNFLLVQQGATTVMRVQVGRRVRVTAVAATGQAAAARQRRTTWKVVAEAGPGYEALPMVRIPF
jgi:hypothetical protein